MLFKAIEFLIILATCVVLSFEAMGVHPLLGIGAILLSGKVLSHIVELDFIQGIS